MNSRERVLKTVRFEEPDRVPVDLGGMKASGIAVEAYLDVCRQLGIPGVPRVCDARFMTGWVEEAVLKRFNVDVVPLDLPMAEAQLSPEAQWVPRTLFSGNRVLFPPGTAIAEEADGGWNLLNADGTPSSLHMPRDGHYFDDVSFDRGDPIDPARFKPVDTLSDEVLDAMARHSKELYEGTEYALLGWGCGVCFLGLSLITERRSNVTMGRPSDWMMMLMTEPEQCHEMMGRSVDASIRCLELLHQAVGDRAFAWGVAADDSGTQRGEFIRPDLWAEMLKPHYTRLCGWIHAHTPWKTFLHSCGSVYHLIPHFIEAGVDILNPVQTSAANMDPARLKAEFGKKIVLWGGGCDTQHVLGSATPGEVRRHVRERMDVFKPGGGYVFNQVHNIQANVPAENVVAMFDAARDFGRYS
jgi:uroporphyrinogen-III decarboxylase